MPHERLGKSRVVRSALTGTTEVRVLITGASGDVGSEVRRAIRERYEFVRCLDIRQMDAAGPNEEVMIADLNDPGAAARAVEGIDVVFHAAGYRMEGSWEQILPANIEAVVALFEAARAAAVKRIVYASSHHAVGYYPMSRALGTEEPTRPDSRYAVSKVFGEALCRLFSDKYGISTISLRIGAFRPEPQTPRHLAVWISPGDMGRLAIASIEASDVHCAIVYGVSANTRRVWTDDAAAEIGYVPQDDADALADMAEISKVVEPSLSVPYHGGLSVADEFCGDEAKLN